MAGYTVTEGTAEQRRQVREWLAGLDRVSPALAETMVTAWVSRCSTSMPVPDRCQCSPAATSTGRSN